MMGFVFGNITGFAAGILFMIVLICYKRMKGEVERFFNSDWYSELTDLNGAFLMRKIQEEVGYHDSERIPKPGVLDRQRDKQ